MIDPTLDDAIGRHHESNGECDACESDLPDDYLLNENGQFCNEACEADHLAPKTLAACVQRDYGLRPDGGRI